MIPVESLNAWGAAWCGVHGPGARRLLGAAGRRGPGVWFPLRRRMSAQFAHGLFCLVLLKLVGAGPGHLALVGVRPVAAAGGRPGSPPGRSPATRSCRPTGDLGVSRRRSTTRSWSIPAPSRSCRGRHAERRDEPVRARRIPPKAASRPRALDASRPVLMIAWAVLSTLLLLRFAPGRAGDAPADPRRGTGSARAGSPVDLEGLRRAAGIRSPVRWAISPRLHSPAVGGLIRPTVVIPPDLDDGPDARAIELGPAPRAGPRPPRRPLGRDRAAARAGGLLLPSRRSTSANWVIDQLREYACDDAAPGRLRGVATRLRRGFPDGRGPGRRAASGAVARRWGCSSRGC